VIFLLHVLYLSLCIKMTKMIVILSSISFLSRKFFIIYFIIESVKKENVEVHTEENNSKPLQENSLAPDFIALDLDGKAIKLSDFCNKKEVVVYFYPRDFTPGCTTEAAEFTREYVKFKDANIEIIGVSPDNDDSHKKFREQMKIPYLLASDAQNEISRKYGVYGVKNFMGRECKGVNRSTFLIDKNTIVIKVYPRIKPIPGKGFADDYIKIFKMIANNKNPSTKSNNK
jgi:thioredoxin-dependent peroxiredoxin